ncbi:dnaJ homolog subfamily B member 4 [Ricinus communis]|nr:dnaJ homolog subfamily B member 4 [Ricinus communis]
MVHHPQIVGLPTGASSISEQRKKNFNFKHFCKVYLPAIVRWSRIKKTLSSSPSSPPSNSHSSGVAEPPEAKPKATHESVEELGEEIEEETMKSVHSYSMRGDNPASSNRYYKHKSLENCFPHLSSPLSRNGSRRSPSPSPSFLYRSVSRGSTESNHGFSSSSLSRNASRRSTTPIMFSNSTGMLKPPAVQKYLECTLEDLCHGCTKKIKVTRDVLTNTGQIVQEEELLTIDIKPGWKKGTKITFEGMGNERPGTCPADITFVIAEKRHPLFRREGDDLEIAVEIPLVKALTGCDISIPLLGGERTTLMIDDIIYPGFQKIVKGQGMPNTKEHGKKGNLKVIFLVEFPTELTNEQRSDVLSILEDSC